MTMVVPRFRRRMMRRSIVPPLISFKHQRQENQTYVGGGVNLLYVVYTGVNANVATTPSTVPNGHKVYSVDVSLTFIHQAGSGSGDISWMLTHLRDGQTIGTCFASPNGASDWSNIGLSKCKNQVIKSYISAIGTEDAGPRIWNVHIKIPKQWHRVRDGDTLNISFNGDQTGLLVLGTRFKDYS